MKFSRMLSLLLITLSVSFTGCRLQHSTFAMWPFGRSETDMQYTASIHQSEAADPFQAQRMRESRHSTMPTQQMNPSQGEELPGVSIVGAENYSQPPQPSQKTFRPPIVQARHETSTPPESSNPFESPQNSASGSVGSSNVTNANGWQSHGGNPFEQTP
ncbi:MAG: hypothetical protein Tsb009_00190 [Planctomycetaceae bacterium]